MKTLKIFISSTFKDMNAERDVLIKTVFPRLREKAEEELGVRIQEIDLRWGVTEEQVMRGDVVELCLDGIEECKPYFLCMIGKRYGWIPAPHHIRRAEFEVFIGAGSGLTQDEITFLRNAYGLGSLTDRVYQIVSGLPIKERQRAQAILERAGLPQAVMSITEQEINYVLSELELPRSIIDLDNILISRTVTLTQDELSLLDSFYVRETGGQRTWWLQPGATDQEKVLLRSIIDKLGCLRRFHSFFFLRKDAGEDHEQYIETNETGRKRLDALRERVHKLQSEGRIEGLAEYECSWNKEIAITDDTARHPIQNLKQFEEVVFKSLWEHIKANPEMKEERRKEAEKKKPEQETFEERLQRQLEEENELHERFVDSWTWNFYGRKEILFDIEKKIHAALTENREINSGFVILVGEPGSGKSALMAKTFLSLVSKETVDVNQPLVIGRFIGASSRSVLPANILNDIALTLIREFNITDPVTDEHGQVTGVKPAEIPSDTIQLQNKMNIFFSKAVRPVVIILDAVNQVRGEFGSQKLSWLPYQLPQNVCFVISLIEEIKGNTSGNNTNADKSAFDAIRNRWQKYAKIPVESLLPEEKAGIVTSYLKKYNKQLSPDLLNALIEKQESGNPLYLQAALEELRILGRHELLQDFIRKRLPQTTVEMFEFILNRVEADLATRFGPDHESLFRDFMVFLATGRNGMTEVDIRMLLGDWKKINMDTAYEEKRKQMPELMLPEYLWGELRRSMRPYLFMHGEEWDFYHGQVKEAVREKWLKVWKKEKSEEGKEEKAIEEAHRIIVDYLEVMGYKHLTTSKELVYQLNKAGRTEDLRKLLLTYEWIREKLEAENVHELLNDYNLDKKIGEEAKIVRNAIRLSAHLLRIDKNQIAAQLTARLCGYNVTNIGIDKFLKNIILNQREYKTPWIRSLHPAMAQANGLLIQTLVGHKWRVDSVAVDSAGLVAVSAGFLDPLMVWNLENGELIHRLTEFTFPIGGTRIVSITPNGRIAVLASKYRTMKVLDLKSGKALYTLKGHSEDIIGVAIDSAGLIAVSCSRDRTLKVWDLKSGKELYTLKGHTDTVNDVVIDSLGLVAVSCSRDRTLKVWDLKSGKDLYTLKGHTDVINGVALDSLGLVAVSASHDRTLKVWDLKGGKELNTLKIHSGSVECVAVDSAGHIAVSASADNTLKAWDLKSGKELYTLKGHIYPVNSVAIDSAGYIAVSASMDAELKVWNIKRDKALHTLGHADSVKCVAIDSAGRIAVSASADKTLKVWNIKSGKELHTLKGHTNCVFGVAVDSAGLIAVSASGDNDLKVWDLKSGKELYTLKGHTKDVFGVAVDSAGLIAVSASGDGDLKVWDLKSGKELHTLKGYTEGVFDVAVDSAGLIAVSASRNGDLKVWDLKSGKELYTLKGHVYPIRGVDIDSLGLVAVSASNDSTLKVWDLQSGKELYTLKGHTMGVFGVAVDSAGLIAVSASNDNTLKVWNIKNGKALATFYGEGPIICCAVSPDGKTIVAGEHTTGTVYFLRLENWNPLV